MRLDHGLIHLDHGLIHLDHGLIHLDHGLIQGEAPCLALDLRFQHGGTKGAEASRRMEGSGSQASPTPNLRDSLQVAMGNRTRLSLCLWDKKILRETSVSSVPLW